jgi:hypothetical protein
MANVSSAALLLADSTVACEFQTVIQASPITEGACTVSDCDWVCSCQAQVHEIPDAMDCIALQVGSALQGRLALSKAVSKGSMVGCSISSAFKTLGL